ncbi:MAG: hypothetical protein AAGD08_15940 [Pseudomonadota bacterium]
MGDAINTTSPTWHAVVRECRARREVLMAQLLAGGKALDEDNKIRGQVAAIDWVIALPKAPDESSLMDVGATHVE